MKEYIIKELKQMGKEQVMRLKDELEDKNCNLDYTLAADGLIMEKNNKTIRLIE